MRFLAFLLLAGSLQPAAAQLTPDQKTSDFLQLVALYDKNYGPYGWKLSAFNYDALTVKPWLDQIAATKTDLDFYEVCISYVAALNDAHDVFTLPSTFVADLRIRVDLYDGKLLIDAIDRSALPAAKFPFKVGDEIVSVDGKLPEDYITAFQKYAIAANPLSTRRGAAYAIALRQQSRMPHAADVGDSATVVVRSQDGSTATYQIPWVKSGLAIGTVGPVPSPKSNQSKAAASAPDWVELREGDNPWGAYIGDRPDPDPVTERTAAFERMRTAILPSADISSRFTPLFNPPAGFKQRLGAGRNDVFLSGTFPAGNSTVGFIRIPDFAPASTNQALQQWITEIAYFNQNTDGLVIDTMNNPGGSVCYTEFLANTLVPTTFRVLGFELRANQFWLDDFDSVLQSAIDTGAEQWEINLYSLYLRVIRESVAKPRGQTGAIPLCTASLDRPPLTLSDGSVFAFTKPIVLLTNERTASGGDAFAAMLQDAKRDVQYGQRTMGAGGSVANFPGTTYSEGSTRVTMSLMVRKNPIVTSDYPTAPYVENIGVRPDILAEFQTKDNLLTGGKTFVDGFVKAIQDAIAGK